MSQTDYLCVGEGCIVVFLFLLKNVQLFFLCDILTFIHMWTFVKYIEY